MIGMNCHRPEQTLKRRGKVFIGMASAVLGLGIFRGGRPLRVAAGIASMEITRINWRAVPSLEKSGLSHLETGTTKIEKITSIDRKIEKTLIRAESGTENMKSEDGKKILIGEYRKAYEIDFIKLFREILRMNQLLV